MTNEEKFKRVFRVAPVCDICSIIECPGTANCDKCRFENFWSKEYAQDADEDFKEECAEIGKAAKIAYRQGVEDGKQKGRDEALDILLHVDHQMYGIVVDKIKKEEKKE